MIVNLAKGGMVLTLHFLIQRLATDEPESTVRVLTVFEGEVYWRELGFQLDNHIINNITITTAIARKLRLTLVIEEHFEFTIRAAHTVKISACAHCIVRLPLDFRHTTAIQPPYNRHSEQVPVHKYRYIYQFCYISAKSGIKPSN